MPMFYVFASETYSSRNALASLLFPRRRALGVACRQKLLRNLPKRPISYDALVPLIESAPESLRHLDI